MKKIAVLQFCSISGKILTPNKALKYPLTPVPLSLAEPDQILRQQSTKATLHRFLHEKSGSIVKETQMKQTGWLMEWQKLQLCHHKKHIRIFLMHFLIISN